MFCQGAKGAMDAHAEQIGEANLIVAQSASVRQSSSFGSREKI
jgi:hypothetical protein